MANCLILGHTPCPISPLSENNHVHGVEATDDLVEQLGSNSDQHGSELQNLTDTHSREVELESLSESVQQERRSERFSEPTPDLPEVKIETEKMEAVAQAPNPIPSLEDLIITDTAADGGDNGQTTQPRVPDLSGKGAVTLATEENSSDLGIDGPVCVLNGINESLNPPGTEDAPENNNTTPKDLSSKSSGGKSKRKEDKAIEHILKALNSLDTTEEKLAALCKKYADLHEEHRVQQASFKQTQKKLQVTSREKDQLQSEHNKAVMAKGKLESLCRELQKHNKLIKEESITRAREEEERRKEVSSKFQCTISEIQAQMQDNHDRNIKLKEENIELGHKLKSLVEQYETREEHVEKLMKHRDLETQLHEAKLQQAQVLLQSEQEQNRKEREVVLMTMTETKKKSDLHEAQEKQLRSQLAMYTEKFDEFQTTLNKSNEVFGKFKTEMDKMTKRIKKLEKESAMWRGKWEASNKNLLEMAEEKQKHDKEKVLFRAKIEKLESLCRALQAERRGKGAEGSLPEMGLESGDKEKTFDPTKTPPNTPDVPSRTSPETLQGAADGQGEGLNSAAQPVTASELADGEGPIPASLPIQEQLEAAPVSEAEIPPANDLPLPEQPSVSQSDDSGAAQLSEPVSASQSNHTAAAPANQLDASVQNAD